MSEDIERVEKLIRVAKGEGKICRGVFKTTDDCFCPIGWVLERDYPGWNDGIGIIETAARILSISEDQVWSFVRGFDTRDGVLLETDNEFRRLGFKLQKEWL